MPFETDAGALFLAGVRHDDWRDDANTLEVGTNGLLTSANVEATGRAGDVIGTFAGVVASPVTLAGGVPPVPSQLAFLQAKSSPATRATSCSG